MVEREQEKRPKFQALIRDCRTDQHVLDLPWAYSSQGRWQRRFVNPDDRMRMNIVLSWCDGSNRVIDIGCGDGKMAAALGQKGCEVVACDISIEQLRLGKEASKLVDFVRADATHLPLRSESIDIVFAGEVMEHVQSAFQSLLEWGRVLRRKGCLIASTPNTLSFGRICQHLAGLNPGIWNLHLNFYDYYSVQQLLNFAGYDVKEILTIRVPIPYFGFRFFRLQTLLARINPALGDTIVARCQKSSGQGTRLRG